MNKQAPEIDMASVRRAFDAAADTYDQHAVLQLEVGERLLSRLDWLQVSPSSILDLGAGTGQPTLALLRRYRAARLLALDLSATMLRKARRRRYRFRRPYAVCGDFHRLPFADASFDMVFSNLALQWCVQPDLVFAEVRRVLAPHGVLLFSSFGPDTLKELRSSWAATDNHHHVHTFMDMHDVGDIMLQAGLQEPVMSREMLTVTYDSVRAIMQDLKYIGASNAIKDRARGLLGRGRLLKMQQAYEKWRVDDRLPVSYEAIYGVAWGQRENTATIALDTVGKLPGAK